MQLLFKLLSILLFFSCGSNVKNLLPRKEIKIESNYKYVVANGEDKVSVEIIEETLDKGIGTKKRVEDFEIKVHSLINNRINRDLDESIVIEGRDIKFKTPGDYSIMAIYNGKETKKPAIVKARKDLKNISHVSRYDNFELTFKDEESNEIIPDVKFKNINGDYITRCDIKELVENRDKLELKAFLHGSELGVLIIYFHDFKLEIKNNIAIKEEENQLEFNVIKEDDQGKIDIIKNYTLIYKKGKKEKLIEIIDSNLKDFEKLITKKINRHVENYEICASIKVEYDQKKYELRTNVIDLFALNKWEENKNLLASQPLNLNSYKNFYRNIKVKAFSRYENDEQKELNLDSHFQEKRIGFTEINFEINSKKIGKIKIKSLGIINVKKDNEPIIFEINNRRVAYLDRNNLKSFSFLAMGENEKEIPLNSTLEWRLYLNRDEYKIIKSFSEIESLNLDNLRDYEFKFVYISPFNGEKFKSKSIFIKLFEKPSDQVLQKPLLGGSKAELKGLEFYLEHLNISDNYKVDEKEFVNNKRIFSHLTYFKSNNFIIYKFEDKVYISPLKAFNFGDKVEIKIGNTPFCKVKLEVRADLVQKIEVEKWLGINNKGNSCFANSAFKFLSLLNLVDYYIKNEVEEKLIILGKEEHVSALQYLKAIINGIRLGGGGSFSSKEVAGIFIKNFLNLNIIQIKETKINENTGEIEDRISQNFGDGSQHDVAELLNSIMKILLYESDEIKKDDPSFLSILVKTSKFNGDKNSIPKIKFDNCTNLTLDLRGTNSQEALNEYFNNEKINLFYNLYKDNSEKVRFKIGKDKSRSISAKNIKELEEKLRDQEYLLVNSKGKSYTIEVKENELLNILENKGKIEDNKRYKIVFQNENEKKEYFILAQTSSHTSTINLFIGIDNVEATRELFIKKSNEILYLNFKRLTKDRRGNIIKIFSNTKMEEQIQIQNYDEEFNKSELKKYRLIGAIIHEGGAKGGHYYAYIKGKNGWTKQNDSSTSLVKSLPEATYCSLAYELIK